MRAALLLLLALPLFADDLVDAGRGFRIGRPGAPWSCAETPAPEETTFAYKISRSLTPTEVSVTLYLADAAGYSDAKTACDLAEARWKADPLASKVSRAKGTLAGADAPSLRWDYAVGGATYLIRQQYLVHEGTLYALQSLAPAAEFEKDLPDFDAIVATFAFVPIADPKQHATNALVRRLAKRCGSEIAWARDWEEASAQARKEGKLVAVVVELYAGLLAQRYAPSTTFMDSDVVELMQQRFVGLQWIYGMKAPFVSPEVYGLGPGTFGMGVLFVDADGKVVGEAVSLNPFYFYKRAAEVLGPSPEPEPKTLLERADLLCRQRRGDEALQALAEARKAGEKVDLQEAVVRLRRAEYAKAETLLEGRDDPESRYWRACAKAMRLGIEAVRADLESLATAHPESRWAWRGAAMLCNLGLMTGIDRLEWPDEKALQLAGPTEPAKPLDAKAAKDAAVEFLLKSQLADGSWSSPMSLADAEAAVPTAVTSICGMALLPHREHKQVSPSLDRALDVVLRANLTLGAIRLFDYTVWGNIFSLRFLARCTQEGFGDRARLLARVNSIVKEMQAEQRGGGGWAYVRLSPAEGTESNSIGFVTAAAVLSLLDAKAAGAEVPAGLMEKAVGALSSLARPGGSFGYMQLTGAGGDDAATEASLRSPLYALALLRAGKADVAALRKALEVYLAHHTHARAERGKGLCHTSPEGIASYYLLYGYGFSAEALQSLPAAERTRFREALLEDVLFMRDADGSFCDNPAIGRCYGTAAALRALDLLDEAK